MPNHTVDDSTAIARRIKLARCLKGAYAVARAEDAAEWWDECELVPWQNLFTKNESYNPEDENIPTEKEIAREEKQIYFHVLRRIKNRDEKDPVWIVACRGTIVHHIHDLKEDFKIWLAKVTSSPSYRLILKVVEKLCKLHGAENVCVTGHSLGAAYGLLVWRTLALQNKYLATYHLFNPPHGNLRVMLQCIYRPFRKFINLHGTVEKCVCKILKIVDQKFRSKEAEKLDIVKSKEALQLLHMYINTADIFSEGFKYCTQCGENKNDDAGEKLEEKKKEEKCEERQNDEKDEEEEFEEEENVEEKSEDEEEDNSGYATLHMIEEKSQNHSIYTVYEYMRDGRSAHRLLFWLSETIIPKSVRINFDTVECIFRF